MAASKQRLLQDLYHVTRTLSQPKITPVLRGKYQIQGPVDGADYDVNTNMVPSHIDEECNSYPKNLKSNLGAESGICNVCSAPCSSCLHNQCLMGSKIDECSGETCNDSALSFSVNGAAQDSNSKKSEPGQKGEILNLVSGNSCNTSEDVDCEARFKNTDISPPSGDVVLSKVDDLKGKEGYDHYVSEATGTKETELSNFNVKDGDRAKVPNYPAFTGSLTPQENGKTVSHPGVESDVVENQNNNFSRESKSSEESLEQVHLSVSSQSDASLQKLDSVGASSENASDAIPSLKPQDNLSLPSCGKSLYGGPISKNYEENLCQGFVGPLLESPNKHLNLLSMEELISDVANSVDALNHVEKNEGFDKVVGSAYFPGAKHNPTDDNQDDNMVEHDVKVCDICGDSGREELLAICFRCSDGAEHTYCMREMLEKVPEGYWHCEECKVDLEIKNQRQDIVRTVGLNEKDHSSGWENPEKANFSMISEPKGSDAEDNRSSKDPSGVKISGKSHTEDVEVSSATKKRALDHNVRPTKMLASSSFIALSRGSSFKHLDREKIKPTQQSPPCTISAPELADYSASTSLLQSPQRTFIKSNSFNSLNMKPKVKLMDDMLPQMQRSVKDPASLDKKEGAARPIGKSMSFKYANPGRLNSNELKVKMLSSKFSHIQNVKGSRHGKDRSLFERNNSFNQERPSVSSPGACSSVLTAKKDKKLPSYGEPNLLSSVRSYCDSKAVQSDSKSVMLSRSSSSVARKASEMPFSFGESKRLSSQLTSSVGGFSTNEVCCPDLKPSLSSLKEDSSSSPYIAEQPPCNANEGLQDGLSRSRESTNLCERQQESYVSRSKHICSNSGRSPCHKCEEFGHLPQFCSSDCPGSVASDTSAAKSSRDIMDCKDKLKAAIEAAVLRKPGIYRKHKVSDQSDDVSVLSINCEIASQDHLMNSSNRENMSAAEEPEGHMIQGSSTADSCKLDTVDNLNQLAMSHIEASFLRTGNACPAIPSEGLFTKDILGHVPSTMSLHLKTLAIPDHNYIWQGIFEVCRGGRNLSLCEGIQAHLSSCASHKVLEAVNKFPRKVILNEVPRLSTWPVQFQEYGAKEDNIALFFFAKDLLSYEKSYKALLDNMMKNDLALKGNLSDAEVMIFPSNQLPERSQRWNTLFFLWGVFRGKRSDCLDHVPSSIKPIHGPMDKDFPEWSDPASAPEVPASKLLPCSSSAQTWNGDCDTRLSSRFPLDYHTKTIVEKQDDRMNSCCFSMVQSNGCRSCEEAVGMSISREDLADTNPSLDVSIKPDDKFEGEHRAPAEASRRVGFNRSEQMPMHSDICPSGLHSLHRFDESPADEDGRPSVRSMDEGNLLDNMSNTRCQEDLADGSMHETSCSTVDHIVKDNYRRCQHVDLVVRISKAAASCSSQVIPENSPNEILVEEVPLSKKQKTDFCALKGGNDQADFPIEGFMPQINGVASGSPNRINGHDEAFDQTDAQVFEGNAERYLFPFDPRPDAGQGGKSSLWRIDHLEENRLHDRAPNLELALGAETKSSSQSIPSFLAGMKDKRIIQDHCSQDATTKGEDDDVSASLSLSLSFPFPDKELTVKSVSQAERQHVNTSLLLFGGLREK